MQKKEKLTFVPKNKGKQVIPVKLISDKQNFELVLNEEKIEANIALGQNFIFSYNLLREIVSYINVDLAEVFIEIGAGTGNLTKVFYDKLVLSETEKSFFALEIDKKLMPYLQKRFLNYDGLQIIEGDALKFDFGANIPSLVDKKFTVFGNLPYYITTDLIITICSNLYRAQEFIFLVQLEACDRINPKFSDKSYGPLGIYLQILFDYTFLQKISKDFFIPKPKIDSALIRLSPKKFADKSLAASIFITAELRFTFFKFLKLAFQDRRKQFANNLMKLLKLKDRQEAILVLADLGYKAEVRAEAIKAESYQNLFLLYLKNNKML